MSLGPHVALQATLLARPVGWEWLVFLLAAAIVLVPLTALVLVTWRLLRR